MGEQMSYLFPPFTANGARGIASIYSVKVYKGKAILPI